MAWLGNHNLRKLTSSCGVSKDVGRAPGRARRPFVHLHLATERDRSGVTWPALLDCGVFGSEVLSKPLKERMPHFALSRLRPVFDFRHQLGLDPYPAMRNPPTERLRLPDQRL
jgi:hypothetical protein